MKILSKDQIQKLTSIPEILEAIERGFVAYSQGETTIPPVASLHLDNPVGDCHIKYGYAKKGKYYVVKIASGFHDNPKQGLPSGNGLMLLFDRKTGVPLCLLQDEGYLTDIRTAVAGCLAAKYLSPKNVSCVGIIGTGAQAFYQLKFLSFATKCRKALIWGRNPSKTQKLASHRDLEEWDCAIANSIEQLTAQCNLIVTTTSSSQPILFVHQIMPGTHLTAMGADDVGKQEIDPQIFAKADKIIVDSKSQCALFSDVSHALKAGLVQKDQLIELGDVIADQKSRRFCESEITIADLTGVAIQDLQIAATVFEAALGVDAC